MVEVVALGLIGHRPALLIEVADLQQQGALFFPIGGGDAAGAFEEHVLQVVGKTGGIHRIVLAARAHGDVSLHTGCIIVGRQVHGQAVVQRVDPRLQRVVGHGHIAVVLLGGGHAGDGDDGRTEQGPCSHGSGFSLIGAGPRSGLSTGNQKVSATEGQNGRPELLDAHVGHIPHATPLFEALAVQANGHRQQRQA